MSLENTDPTTTTAWKKLARHYNDTKDIHLKKLFAADSRRAEKFSTQWNDFFVDYSKNKITEETMALLSVSYTHLTLPTIYSV